MGWEPQASQPGFFSKIYSFFEDFAEWVVLGFQSVLKSVGLPVVSGLSLLVKLLIGATVFGGLLFVGVWVGHTWGSSTLEGPAPPLDHSTSDQPAVTSPSSPARDVLSDFFKSVNSHKYSLAYDDLTPAWKRELPFKDFESRYRDMDSIDCVVKNERKLRSDRIELDVELAVTQSGSTRSYRGTYQAEDTRQGWRLGYFMRAK